MILPTKRISPQKSLIGVGCDIIVLLNEPTTVSRLWSEYKKLRSAGESELISYDWFVLALDLLYMIDAIKILSGYILKQKSTLKQPELIMAAAAIGHNYDS